jgi:hypothetical protein
MKSIQHSVFVESVVYPIWSLNAGARRERNRERIRQRAEAFINEIGVENVVSIAEHATTFGPFSVAVWWYREFTEADTLVVRASGDEEHAQPPQQSGPPGKS